MKCPNTQCGFNQISNNSCKMEEDMDIDMAAEDFIENDVCGWVKKNRDMEEQNNVK